MWTACAVAGAVFVLVAILTRAHGFVWDDLDLVVRDGALRGGDWAALLGGDFARAAGGQSGLWRPLATLSLALDWRTGGGSPLAFHLTNALLHAAGAALAGVWVARLVPGRAAAALGALVFACSASQAESASWIAARTDALASLGTLAFLLLDGRGPGRARTFAAPVALALALAGKETAVAAPLLALIARGLRGEKPGAVLRDPAVGAWVGVLAAWAFAHARFADPVRQVAGADRAGLLAGAPALLFAQLAQLLPFFPHTPLRRWDTPGGLAVALGAAGLIVAAVGFGVAWARRSPAALAIAVLVLPLVPACLGPVIEGHARWADRFVGLPAAGLALALALAVARASVRAPGAAVLVRVAAFAWPLVQLPAFVAMTGVWASDEARLRFLATTETHGTDARLGFADLLAEQGRAGEARAWIDRADRAEPSAAAVPAARGALALRAGDEASALREATEALRRDPASVSAGLVRISALQRLQRAPEALAAVESLSAAHPGIARVELQRASLLLGARRDAEASAALERAVRELPSDAGAWFLLGVARARRGALEPACEAFSRAAALDPARADAWLLLAGAEARRGRLEPARAALARAAERLGGTDPRVEAIRRELEGAREPVQRLNP